MSSIIEIELQDKMLPTMSLFDAAYKGNLQEVVRNTTHNRQCVFAKDEHGYSAMHHAIIGCKPDCVKIVGILMHTVEQNSVENMIKLVDAQCVPMKSRTSLHLAIETGNVELVELILRAPASLTIPDANGFWPVHLASKNLDKNSRDPTQEKIVRVLLEAHLEAGVVIDTIKTTKYFGMNVIHLAAMMKSVNILQLCLDEKYSKIILQAQHPKLYPIHCAINTDDSPEAEKCVELLLTFDTNCAISLGEIEDGRFTPALLAAAKGHHRLLKLLLEHPLVDLHSTCVGNNNNVLQWIVKTWIPSTGMEMIDLVLTKLSHNVRLQVKKLELEEDALNLRIKQKWASYIFEDNGLESSFSIACQDKNMLVVQKFMDIRGIREPIKLYTNEELSLLYENLPGLVLKLVEKCSTYNRASLTKVESVDLDTRFLVGKDDPFNSEEGVRAESKFIRSSLDF